MSWFKINQSQIIDPQLRQANHPRSIKITELTTEKKKLPSKYPRPLGRLIALGGKYIDLKMGLIGAAVMAAIVFVINYLPTYDVLGATTAALKQGIYTAIFGGFIMRLSGYFATRIKNRFAAMAAAMIIPSVIAISLTFCVHSMKGTPEPVGSTIPTAIFVIPSTAIWGYLRRKNTTTLSEVRSI